jgi:hypothetical protein
VNGTWAEVLSAPLAPGARRKRANQPTVALMASRELPFHIHEGELREAKNRQLAAAFDALVLTVTGQRACACLATNSISPTRPRLPEMGPSPVPAARLAARLI